MSLNSECLKLKTHISETAHLFYIVDQISGWHEFTHSQYRHYFCEIDGGYSESDKEMLNRHAAIRQRRTSQNPNFAKVFFTPQSIDTAINTSLEKGLLTPEEAQIEKQVLTHFAPRIKALLEASMANLKAFEKRLLCDREDLEMITKRMSRFCLDAQIDLPVYLFVSPHDDRHGGAVSQGCLLIEIPRVRDAYPTFLHELFHVFLKTQQDLFMQCANSVESLDVMTLNEGIAYAFSPGLYHSHRTENDPLLKAVAKDIQEGKPLDDWYCRFRRFGLALRPLFRKAFEDETQTLETFLPRSLDVWNALVELDEAMAS